MANPNIPGKASNPIPPPVANFPFTDPRSGLLTPLGLEFLQYLWASIQGSGGVIDNITLNIGDNVSATAESVFAQQSDKASPLSSLLGKMAGLEQQIASLRALIVPNLLMQPPFSGLAPLVGQRISPSAVQWTPIIAGATTPGTQTYATQTGFYVEVGPLVLALFSVSLSALDGTTAGFVTITGLPIPASTNAGTIGGWIGMFGNVTLGGGYTTLGLQLVAGGNLFTVLESGSASAITPISAGALSNTSSITGGCVYLR